jgi:3-oxo-5-alpha-steroid 4-dehydrogenase 1
LRNLARLSLGYSKFAGIMDKTPGLPSRLGMFLLYFPALLVYVGMHAAADAAAVSSNLHRACLVMVGGHFLKRCAEVLFVHRYSGVMNLLTCALVSVGYATMSGILAVTAIHRLSASASPEGYTPGNMAIGGVMWVAGQFGNFYHHHLLASLRSANDKSYKVPKGGLFKILCCPHYTCELVAWAGFAIVLNHIAAYCLLSFFVLYLLGRGRSVALPPHPLVPAVFDVSCCCLCGSIFELN